MKLEHVTITGADDNTDPLALAQLSKEHAFVEWGILVSKKRTGAPRYPSMSWIDKLVRFKPCIPRLSLHVCGQWVRDLLGGNERDLVESVPGLGMGAFQRLQLNTGGEASTSVSNDMRRALDRLEVDQVIIQQASAICNALQREDDDRYVGLFDQSGGTGKSPSEWPTTVGDESSSMIGMSGGLGPDNIAKELRRIAAAVGRRRVWIDMESNVRGGDPSVLDIFKVERVLEYCGPFVRH